MLKYFIAPKGDFDLLGIRAYIETHSAFEAEQVYNAFFRTFEILADFPELAPKSYDYPGARRHTGSGKIHKYFIYYWVHEGVIEILRVIHSARDQAQAILDGKGS